MPAFISRLGGQLADHALSVFSHQEMTIIWRLPLPFISYRNGPFMLSHLFRPAVEAVLARDQYRGKIIQNRIGTGLAGEDVAEWMSYPVHPEPLSLNYVQRDILLFYLRRRVFGDGAGMG